MGVALGLAVLVGVVGGVEPTELPGPRAELRDTPSTPEAAEAPEVNVRKGRGWLAASITLGALVPVWQFGSSGCFNHRCNTAGWVDRSLGLLAIGGGLAAGATWSGSELGAAGIRNRRIVGWGLLGASVVLLGLDLGFERRCYGSGSGPYRDDFAPFSYDCGARAQSLVIDGALAMGITGAFFGMRAEMAAKRASADPASALRWMPSRFSVSPQLARGSARGAALQLGWSW